MRGWALSGNRVGEINSLQVGRALAAISVVVHHATVSVTQFVGLFPERVAKILDLGWLGADFFFVLSGFIIYFTTQSKPSDHRGALEYAKSRIIRIFVPFLPISICLMSLYLMLPNLSAGSRKWSVLASLTLLPVGSPALSVAWTLQHELVFYAIFAVGFYTRHLWLTLSIWCASIIIMMIFNADLDKVLIQIFFSPINLEFLFGIACSVLTFHPLRNDEWGYGLIFVAAFGIWAMIGFDRQFSPVAGLGIAALIILIVRRELAGHLRMPGWAVFLGSASYAIYLVHVPLLSITTRLAALVPMLTNIYVALLFGVMMATGAGCMYHLWFEKPVSTRVKRLLGSYRERSEDSQTAT